MGSSRKDRDATHDATQDAPQHRVGSRIVLGPSQQQELRERGDPGERSARDLLFLLGSFLLLTILIVGIADGKGFAGVPAVLYDVASFTRMPISAQDRCGSLVIIALCLFPLIVVDYGLCRQCMPNAGSRWFLLHAIGNMVVSAMCLPDFYHVFLNPPAALSVQYCRKLGDGGATWACSEWPTALIIAMHVYHMIGFRLNKDDLFHHLLFVPVIGGIHFVYPWGAAGNVLCFFISGLPGGISYFMLSAVKAGYMSSFFEKRINCSINTWIRSPGMVMFLTLAMACYSRPYPGTPPSDLFPWYVWWPCAAVVFFNGQYYAQRVIGNYYIRKAQDCQKRGISRVDLHTS